MDISTIETTGLGDRSYLVSHESRRSRHRSATRHRPRPGAGRRAWCDDHPRPEAHLHNDYVTGGLELSRSVNAEYVVPAGDDVAYARRAVHSTATSSTPDLSGLRVIHTPGHTHHHVSYILLPTAAGTVLGVFTGGSMLHGTTGMIRSARRRPTPRPSRTRNTARRTAWPTNSPEAAQVYPTHGFGSFCSATPASGDASTIG